MQLDNNKNSNYNNLDSLWGELPPLAPLRADSSSSPKHEFPPCLVRSSERCIHIYIYTMYQLSSMYHYFHNYYYYCLFGILGAQRSRTVELLQKVPNIRAQKKRRCTLHRSLLIALLCSLLIALIAFIAIVCCCCMYSRAEKDRHTILSLQ